jgi:hypothetical protein
MSLVKLIKDFFNPEIHKAINNFSKNGEMRCVDKKFPEQILLANYGYVSSSTINMGVVELDEKLVRYKKGCLNPEAIKGFKFVTYKYAHLTEEGERFRHLQHPLRYLYCKVTGETFF